MARAESNVRLVIVQLEKVHGVAEPVTGEPLGAKHWVLVGDSQRRIIRTNGPPLVGTFPLDLVEWSQSAFWIAFQSLRPAGKALFPGQTATAFCRCQIGNCLKLNEGLVFHR